MNKTLLLTVFFILWGTTLSFANSFKECVNLFEKEEFFKAKRCFLSVKELTSYRNYYLNLINEVLEEDSQIPIKEDLYIKHKYLLSKVAKSYYAGNKSSAKKILKHIDPKALPEEDYIFFLYLKANLLNDKNLKTKLAARYTYNRAYGYRTFLHIYRELSQKQLWQAVDTLISKRMYKRAEGILPLIENSSKKSYYQLYIYVKTGRYSKARKTLQKIDPSSKWYAVALYILGYYAKNWQEKRRFFDRLLKTKNEKYIQKLALVLTKKTFHYKRFKDFKYYLSHLKPSEEKVWYTFLYKYFLKNKKKAFNYLTQRKNFIKNKNKLNYWLYLSSKNKMYLKLVKTSKENDFYKVIAGGKVKTEKVIINKKVLPYQLKLAKELKKLGLYEHGFNEAMYYYKKNKQQILTVYNAFPEVVVRKLKEKYRFIKPFGDLPPLVYATMKQESLFYYKAISFSNAVGLMQFIPKTAYWAARVRKIKDFDIVQMFNPEVSIDFGRWYLNYLLKRFNGNVFYAISAYNGGETNVKRTIKRFNPKNIAEFIETHPFDETRNYLKKVYTNYVIYKEMGKN